MKTLKTLAAIMALLFLLPSCRVYAPVYKRVENFTIHKLDRDGFGIGGNIVFYNPNKFKFHMNEMLMNVEIDNKHVATAGELQTIVINKNSEFSVPLQLVIKPDMTWNEIVKSVINIFTSKQVNLTIKGTVVVKAMGVRIPITVTDNEKIDLTKLR